MSAVMRDVERLVAEFIEFNETGSAPPELFAEDVFVDFTMPHWRLQAGDREGLIALRRRGHPGPSTVASSRVDVTDTGFVIEWTERWTDEDGEEWYCREMARADVVDGRIADLSVYCTGDWDAGRVEEHRRTVQLLRL
jgi:hypothetical protein